MSRGLFGRTPPSELAPFALVDLATRPREACEAAIRARAANAYLGEGRALARVLGRYKMFVDTRDTDLCAHLLLDGFWEMWITRLLPALVRPGMVCADVGAHVGYFTLPMAELVGPEGAVHAFEPNAALLPLLRDSARLNGFATRVHAHADPLYDTDGLPAELLVPAGQPGGSHLRLLDPEWPAHGPLRTRRLDQVEGLAHADLVKIDAEGAEEAIWRGMRRLFDQRRAMTILLEFAPIRYPDPAGFLVAIRAEGFAVHRVDDAAGFRSADDTEILASAALDQMLVLIR